MPFSAQTGPMQLPEPVLEIIRNNGITYLATLMPDGSPQLTQTWVDTDGEFVIINTVDGHQKLRNIRRDPRVAVSVADPEDTRRFVQLRGQVVRESTDGAVDHIEMLSQRYLGQPYSWYGGRDQVRVMIFIRVDKVGSLR
jgi:PPOX class probable F420-dependent enzyme